MVSLIDQINKTRGTIISDPNEADAFAWAALEPKAPLVQIAFKHPPLPENGVRINITYTGVCQSDVSLLRDKYGKLVPTVFPCVCKHEIVGRVIATGKQVTNLKEGDLVGVGPKRECCSQC